MTPAPENEAAHPRYLPAGESALVVEFGQVIDAALHDRVLALDEAIAFSRQAGELEGILETVPTYRSLMIHFDPRRLSTPELVAALAALPQGQAPRRAKARWVFPACYEPPHAEDLVETARALGLSPDELVALHSGAVYRVYMYGFAPGFVFLGGLPEALSISRRATPRPPAPPGALLIAGGQALIASVSMPTGWHMLGRTPAKTFDPRRDPGFLVAVGDEVLFERIGSAEFAELSRAAEAGETVARRAPAV